MRLINMSSEALEIVFIPALIQILLLKEKEKGTSLTEEEVISIRDNAVCMTVRKSRAEKISEERGWNDIDAENCWADWCHYKDAS